jgi:hypothetical protein
MFPTDRGGRGRYGAVISTWPRPCIREPFGVVVRAAASGCLLSLPAEHTGERTRGICASWSRLLLFGRVRSFFQSRLLLQSLISLSPHFFDVIEVRLTRVFLGGPGQPFGLLASCSRVSPRDFSSKPERPKPRRLFACGASLLFVFWPGRLSAIQKPRFLPLEKRFGSIVCRGQISNSVSKAHSARTIGVLGNTAARL